MEQLGNIHQEDGWDECAGIQPEFQLTTGGDHICLERLQQADIIAEKRLVWTLPMICSFRIPEVVPGGAMVRELVQKLVSEPNWRRKTFVFSWVLIWMADSFLAEHGWEL